MPMKILLVLLPILFTLPAFAQAPAPTPLEIAENRVINAWEALESAQGVLNVAIQLEIEGIALPVQGAGPFAYRNHRGKRLLRIDLDGNISAPAISPTGALPVQFQGLFDGAVAHMMTNMLFQTTVMRHKPKDEDLALGGDALFKALHEDCEVRLLPDREVNGVPCYVFEARVREPGDDPLEPVKWTLCLAKDSGLPLRAQGFDHRGREIFRAFMTDVSLNPLLSLSRFEFVIPPGARVVEGDDFSQLIPLPR